jgi:hypothetical protein
MRVAGSASGSVRLILLSLGASLSASALTITFETIPGGVPNHPGGET